MKNKILLLLFVVFANHLQAYSCGNPEMLFSSTSKRFCDRNMILANSKGEVIWRTGIDYSNLFHIFYTNRDLCGQPTLISDEILKFILENRFDYDKYRKQDNFCISPIYMDASGSVLFSFEITEPGYISSVTLRKLCVWNRDFGVKLIETPGIDHVDRVEINGEIMILHGYCLKDVTKRGSSGHREQCSQYSFIVFSMAKGFWGEHGLDW